MHSAFVTYGIEADGYAPDDGFSHKLSGKGGNDWLIGGSGSDVLLGGDGDDKLFGDAVRVVENYDRFEFRILHYDGTPEVFGEGNDILIGGSGNDELYGAFGSNVMDGGPGNDTLVSQGEYDVLIGDDGRDTFNLTYQSNAEVKIMDFEDGVDKIAIARDSDILELYASAWRHGAEWEWEWFVTETEDGVEIQLGDETNVVINGIEPANLDWVLEGVGHDFVFIA